MLRLFQSAVILLCVGTIPLRANLGETVPECVKRYGVPSGYGEANPKFPFGTIVFSAGSYILVVFLLDTKEVGARITKHDKSAFTDDEIKNIINADSNGTPWTSTVSNDPTCLRWSRSDKATVLYDKDKHVLIFTSEEMAKTYHAAPASPSSSPTNAPTNTSTNAPASMLTNAPASMLTNAPADNVKPAQ